ncbi:hypothetical protein Cgig2_003800 [Carnegiea gigantea]|uniref:Myb/SANT-like domain-containing protein n=1 Tax=Carnegiea gigantea TaxID=171969 RepID=A0A9Q1GS36_9CARY|nr:hypothetical protein Cgig2_003800 [Carnegiea gigantea]
MHSRLRYFKGIYNVVHDLVVGSCTCGFGWDPETKSVVAEKEVWKAYVKASSAKSGNLGKRVRASDNLVKGLSEVASILGREIRAASSNISRAIGFDVELSEKRSKLNEELANLGLTTMERHRAARKIASEPESIDVFFSIPDAERKEWHLHPQFVGEPSGLDGRRGDIFLEADELNGGKDGILLEDFEIGPSRLDYYWKLMCLSRAKMA